MILEIYGAAVWMVCRMTGTTVCVIKLNIPLNDWLYRCVGKGHDLAHNAHHRLEHLHDAVKRPGSRLIPGKYAALSEQHFSETGQRTCHASVHKQPADEVTHIGQCACELVKDGKPLFSEYPADDFPYILQVVTQQADDRNNAGYHAHDRERPGQ